MKNTLIEDVTKLYEKSDKAHNMDHINVVLSKVDRIATLAKLSANEKYLLTIAAYCHDIYATKDRINHHTLAGAWCEITLPDYGFSRQDTRIVASACSEHRASYVGEFSNIVSECLSICDRSIGKVEDMVARSIEYQLAHTRCMQRQARAFAIRHVKEKYGKGGYAYNNASKLFYNFYESELKKMWKEIDKL